MSRINHPGLIIEWSPGDCSSWSPDSHISRNGENLAQVASGYSGVSTLLAVSRSVCFVRTTSLPVASRPDTELLIRNLLPTLFPLPANEMAFDFMTVAGGNGNTQVALIVAMKSSLLSEMLDEAESAGLKVVAVVPAALSAPTVVNQVGLKSAALVQPFESGIAIDVVHEGVLRYSRTVSLVGDAESEIERTFAAAGLDCYPSVSVGGALLNADYDTTGGTLVSLGLTDLSHPGINLELTETKVARARSAKSAAIRNSLFALAASIVIAGLTASYWVKTRDNLAAQTADAKAEVDSLTKHSQTVSNDLSKISPDSSVIERAFQPAQRMTDVLNVIALDTPHGIWLKGFTSEKGKPFTLEGTSLTSIAVSNFVQKLTTEPRLRDVRLLFANNTLSDKTPVVEFSLTGFPIGNLPLVDQKSNGGGAS